MCDRWAVCGVALQVGLDGLAVVGDQLGQGQASVRWARRRRTAIRLLQRLKQAARNSIVVFGSWVVGFNPQHADGHLGHALEGEVLELLARDRPISARDVCQVELSSKGKLERDGDES
eukprot:7685680-Alexandrium_andersonii.AAC.1